MSWAWFIFWPHSIATSHSRVKHSCRRCSVALVIVQLCRHMACKSVEMGRTICSVGFGFSSVGVGHSTRKELSNKHRPSCEKCSTARRVLSIVIHNFILFMKCAPWQIVGAHQLREWNMILWLVPRRREPKIKHSVSGFSCCVSWQFVWHFCLARA